MLRDTNAMATVAVKDLPSARRFYEDTLGFKPSATEGEEAVVYDSGNSKLLVYRSQFAGTNKATAVSFSVGDDIEQTVQSLKAKGVRFEKYDMPEMKHQGELHIAGDMKAAWFKDPDGNIFGITNH